MQCLSWWRPRAEACLLSLKAASPLPGSSADPFSGAEVGWGGTGFWAGSGSTDAQQTWWAGLQGYYTFCGISSPPSPPQRRLEVVYLHPLILQTRKLRPRDYPKVTQQVSGKARTETRCPISQSRCFRFLWYFRLELNGNCQRVSSPTFLGPLSQDY